MMEVCCFSEAAALAAWQAGAHRIELCGERDLDGITPSPALLSDVRTMYGKSNDGVGLNCPKLFVMLRSRPRHSMSAAIELASQKHLAEKQKTLRSCLDGTCGSWHCAAASLFQVTYDESEELIRTLLSFSASRNSSGERLAAVEGVVFGALKAALHTEGDYDKILGAGEVMSHVQWSVDYEVMQRIATAATSIGIRDMTFHRAFDFVNCFTSPPTRLPINCQVMELLQHVSQCLEFLVSSCGITRILSSSPFCYVDIPTINDENDTVGVSVIAPSSRVMDHLCSVALLVKAARVLLVREDCAASLLTIVLAGGVSADTIDKLQNRVEFQRDGEWGVEFHGSFLVHPDQVAPEVDAVRRAVQALHRETRA